MVKRNLVKRIAAGVLAGILTMTTAVSGIGTLNVNAASSYTAPSENLLKNADFEASTAFGGANDPRLGQWCTWQDAAKETAVTHGGNGSVVFTGRQSSLEQDAAASDMIKGATYVYSVWAKLSAEVAEDSTNYQIGVKNYGEGVNQLIQYVRSTEWTKYEVEFTYTGSEGARVFGWVQEIENSVKMYMDDASLTLKSAIKSVNIENGKISVVFADTLESAPTADDFSASYYLGSDSASAQTLDLTVGTWDTETKTLTLSFDEIAALPGIAQTVNVTLGYKTEAPITLDYEVEAGEGEAVVAALSSVTAENGKVTVVLDKNPTIAPAAAQFTWEYQLDDGEYKALSVSDFTYDNETMTVTVNAEVIRSTTDCEVTVKVTYQEGSKEAKFQVAASEGVTYYVDSTNGNDANAGTTEETAFASIDKLNTITFLPGDSILFKRGETFTGCFKPQGSGEENAPITIGTYGDPEATRPVLMPGEDWTVTHVMSANAMVQNVKVNYVIQFYNVEYWEASGLEIKDPNSAEYLDSTSEKYIGNASYDVYRSGITIQAEDVGTLEHIYIDDMIIHGFHGPLTNIGKTSGGITMNVITNKERDITKSTPTQINDIKITNCEIYDVGRSGINFLTPWSFRTEEKWGSFNYGNRNYEYLPYEDFYMANNYIHDVDGDGTIIDNCADAVAEYNLVTRCNLRSNLRSHSAAVGLFNWNSDNTTFQFNEVYDIRTGINNGAGDAQGIEIDALNDVTYVQYNYVHDNMGGFMMYCNTGDYYRSFDGIVRYNISQNDYAHPTQGLFDIYAANYGTEIYNNTFYFTDRTLNADGKVFLFNSAAAYETMKFYNNIFYYDGDEAVEVNKFGNDIIDWESNIFYGFASLPENDNPSASNMSVDPMLVNPGSGATGEDGIVINREKKDVIDWADVSGYKLKEGSPAINAGVPVDDKTNTRDYFGNEVKGIPDIGAYESGSVALKLMSNNAEIIVDQETMTISVTDTAKVTAKTLLNSLVSEEGVAVEAVRGAMTLTGGIRLAEGDVVTGAYDGETITYTVKVVKGETETSDVIPADYMLATAGTEEKSSENGAASNVLDGNVGTIWHSNYSGTAPTAADKYLTLEIKDGYEYEITGYVYTPRTGSTSGAVNGIITKYEIYTSDNNENWTKVSEGSWAQDSTVKTAVFNEPTKAKYVKLLAVESVNGFVSAAEVRLTGNGGLIDTDVPTTPTVTVSDITDSGMKVQWTESSDSNGIAEYVLYVNGNEYAVFDPDVTSYTLGGLDAGTSYTISIYAVDITGKRSEAASVDFTTTGEAVPVIGETIRAWGSDRNATSLAVADELKAKLNIDKFETIIIATGKSPYDALAGSYLANKKQAPILLTGGKAETNEAMLAYIQANAVENVKIYILGGTSAVSEETETLLKGSFSDVTRFDGATRMDTNLMILKEAGLTGETELLVATSLGFADSLSASATGRPILLVNSAKELNADQKAVLEQFADTEDQVYILGGTDAVSAEKEAEIKTLTGKDAVRFEGKDRYETSVKVAEKFFKDAKAAVVACGKNNNAADGLCGGVLAAAMKAPLLLTKDGEGQAAAYTKANEITSGYVLGGPTVISDETAKEIFAVEKISAKEYKK